VTEERKPKLVVGYDRNRNRNEYSLVEHNQTSEEVQSFLDQWTRHLREGNSFVVLDRTRRHATEKAQGCRACREMVARSDRLEPQAKFIRRPNDPTKS
jgi:hypothetical protein